MTEEEAKTKWCPFARLVRTESNTAGFNMGVDIPNRAHVPLSLCIGAACMAWRRDVQRLHRPHSAESEIIRLGIQWRLDPVDPTYIINDWSGFCGLAGKP